MTGVTSGYLNGTRNKQINEVTFLKFSTVSRGVTTKPNIPDNPRNAWTEERDGIYNEKEMQNLLQVNSKSLDDSFFFVDKMTNRFYSEANNKIRARG